MAGLLVLISCSGQDNRIVLNKNKKGGIFESNVYGKSLTFYDKDESIKVDTSTFISFGEFAGIKRGKSPIDGVFVLDFKLNEIGTLRFKEMTNRNLRKQICFVIDDKIIAAPVISEEITNGQLQMMVSDKKAIDLIFEYFKD